VAVFALLIISGPLSKVRADEEPKEIRTSIPEWSKLDEKTQQEIIRSITKANGLKKRRGDSIVIEFSQSLVQDLYKYPSPPPVEPVCYTCGVDRRGRPITCCTPAK
jgi:hypothetical protein